MIKISITRLFCGIALYCLASFTSVIADDDTQQNFMQHSDAPPQILLAGNSDSGADAEQPRSGSLVLPVDAEKEKAEKKCMTVCETWGEDCMIDQRRGVRKCRRTCKEFGQECF